MHAEVLSLASGGSGFVLRAADMLTTISREWDTVGLEAAAGAVPGAAAPPKKPDVDPMLAALQMLRPEAADPDLPPSQQPGFALALCGCAMQRLHLDDDRGACVVVQWEDGGGSGSEVAAVASEGAAANGKGSGKQQKKRKGGFRITLAELDMSEAGRCVAGLPLLRSAPALLGRPTRPSLTPTSALLSPFLPISHPCPSFALLARGIVLKNSPGVTDSAVAAAKAAATANAGQSGTMPRQNIPPILGRLDSVRAAVRGTLGGFGRDVLDYASCEGFVRNWVRQKHGRFGASGLPTGTSFQGGNDD